MSKTKITAPNGRFTTIEAFIHGQDYSGISFPSSTVAQPWIVRNFQADGTQAGGSAISEIYRDQILSSARQKGLSIEEI